MIPSLDDTTELFAARVSSRVFGPGEIPDDLILRLISAACLAPSGQNRQPWAFHVIIGPDAVGRLADLVDEKVAVMKKSFTGPNTGLFDRYSEFFSFFRPAPVVIAVFTRPYPNLGVLFETGDPSENRMIQDTTHLQSASAAVTQLLLAAEAAGLASCWLTNPMVAADEITAALGVSPPWELMCLAALGNRPQETDSGQRTPKKRYPAEKVSRFHREIPVHEEI